MMCDLEKNVKGTLAVLVIFLITGERTLAESKPLNEKYTNDYFELKTTKSIEDIIDDNVPKTGLFGLPSLANIGIKTGINTAFGILDKKVPEFLNPIMKLTGFDLKTFSKKPIFHTKEFMGKE